MTPHDHSVPKGYASRTGTEIVLPCSMLSTREISRDLPAAARMNDANLNWYRETFRIADSAPQRRSGNRERENWRPQ